MHVVKSACWLVSRSLRGSSALVIAVTLFAVSSAQVITWTKEPPNPSFGVLGENVTLEWGFNITNGFTLVQFQLNRLNDINRYQTVVISHKDGSVSHLHDRIILAKSGTPAFIITTAEEADETEYCCIVLADKTGSDGQKESCVELKILVRPNITAISVNQTSNETDDVTLSCNATGKPTPNITWTREGGNEWKRVGSFLRLKNTSRNHDGVYWCTAGNNVSNTTASVAVTVNYAPSITLSTKKYNFTEGDDMHLECESDGRPPPTVTWLKRDGQNTIAYPSGEQLTIRDANRTEAGVYTCSASNGIGKYATATRTVDVHYSPSIVSDVINQTLNETQELRLVCRATGNPQPLIKWSKRPHPAEMKSEDGVLTAKNVNKTDSGVYQCMASNGIGNDVIALYTVTVNYKPVGTKFTSDARSNTVMTGSFVTFSCTADSHPPPDLELRFHNKTVGMFQNGSFTIQNFSVSHEGMYECFPRNLLGTGPTAHLTLTVMVPPSIHYISRDTTANETDDVKLFCNATGKPIPNITWSLRGDSVQMASVANETLLLRGVSRNQTGSYRCTAQNGEGDPAVAIVSITVNYKPEIRDESPNEIVSWKNHETEMACRAEGIPVPEITWVHNGEEVSSKLTQHQNPVNRLTFTPQEAEDFGLYVCVAKNLLGTATMNITVNQLAVPAPPEILQIERGLNNLEIRWKVVGIADQKYPIQNYLVQIKKGESQKWMNCTTIETEGNSMRCVMEDLETADYIVRVSARNAAGYSEFTVRKVSTQESPGTTDKQRAGLSKTTITWIIGGVIGLASLLVVVVAIVISCKRRRSSSTGGNSDLQAHESSKKVTITSYDNPTMEDSPESTDGPELEPNL